MVSDAVPQLRYCDCVMASACRGTVRKGRTDSSVKTLSVLLSCRGVVMPRTENSKSHSLIGALVDAVTQEEWDEGRCDDAETDTFDLRAVNRCRQPPLFDQCRVARKELRVLLTRRLLQRRHRSRRRQGAAGVAAATLRRVERDGGWRSTQVTTG